ncbi:hypothetical protein TURU_100028 [Turdus rufiventris]|nr:hypothetical protein TURU_100028 [Turdus rufiventris]
MLACLQVTLHEHGVSVGNRIDLTLEYPPQHQWNSMAKFSCTGNGPVPGRIGSLKLQSPNDCSIPIEFEDFTCIKV